MPRRHRHRTMKGGFFESLTSAWESTKKAASDIAFGTPLNPRLEDLPWIKASQKQKSPK